MLKIDRSFVNGLPADADAIIQLGRVLQMQVTVEGVEKDEQRALLGSKGCDVMQGFLFCRPLPAEQLTQLLR